MRKSVVSTLALAAAMSLGTLPILASSHSEAPAITELRKVDGTDLYMFNSYESGRSGYVTLIANYLPFQDAYGGPNFFNLDEDARYRIHIDNTGDGREDLTFQFACRDELRDIKVPVNGVMVSVPLLNVGPVTAGPFAVDPNLNRRELCTLAVSQGPMRNSSRWQFAEESSTGARLFEKPVDNIGQKSIADYEAYARQFIREIDIPFCESGKGRYFVGQRKEPFFVNVGEIFDLVNLNPLGARNAEPNALEDKNITSLILEVPADCLTGSGPVVGAWTTSLLPRNRTLSTSPTYEAPDSQTGSLVQVSRLGMPLVNEVVIGFKDKNLFNASSPVGDAALATYITNPTLPEILQLLFPVQAPNNFPRTDLVATFATGLAGVNLLSDGRPHEMLRLNTSIAPTPAGSQNNLGVLGGDNAGFPNGRRPGDDVVDIELRVAMGALCHALPGVFCNPADAPSGNLPFTDGTFKDASNFDSFFPYLTSPLPGSPNGPNGVD
jgi:hypothetical protein